MNLPEWKPSKALFDFVNNRQYVHTENGLDYWMHREGNRLYVTFQSSNGKGDWKDNFDFFPKKAEPFENVIVHQGFWRQYQGIRNKFLDELYTGVTAVFISGYSLGGAIAQLALYDCLWHVSRDKLPLQVSAVGFNSPRVFVKGQSLRAHTYTFQDIVHRGDVVPHLPPKIFGFKSVGLTKTKIGRLTWFWKAHAPKATKKALLEKYGE